MSKHRNYPYTTLWTDPLMDGWTGLRTDRLNTLWTGPMEGIQKGYFMDWLYSGKDKVDTLWTGLRMDRHTGLAHIQMGWILIFMEPWPTNGTTLQVATILVAMAPKILKLAT